MEAIDILDLYAASDANMETDNKVIGIGDHFIFGDSIFVVHGANAGECTMCAFLTKSMCPNVSCSKKIFREYDGSN
jgi:hypothetical protein